MNTTSPPIGPPVFGAAAPEPGEAAHSTDPHQPEEQLVQETRQQIRQLVAEITRLAQEDITPDRFFAELLDRLITALVAEGGAIWLRQDDGSLARRYHVRGDECLPDDASTERHRLLLHRVLQQAQPLAASPCSGFADDLLAGNPTQWLLLFAPLFVEDEVAGLIEIVQRPGAGPVTQRGYLRFLMQMSELAAGFLKNHRLRQYAERDRVWNRLDQFLTEIHRSLDLPRTALAIVNEARVFLECDRVSLAVCRGSHTELIAVSGVEQLDRRASSNRHLQSLSHVVARSREPFWSTISQRELPPEIEQPWQAYVDQSHVRSIALLPLDSREEDDLKLPGVLILENITRADWPPALKSRLNIVLHYARPALQHALEVETIPFRQQWQWLDRSRWPQLLQAHLGRVLLATGIALLLVLAFLIPWPLMISARGKVVPASSYDVFAPDTGIVTAVHIRHGQPVQAGDLLLEMTNHELDLQIANLTGRRQVIAEELQSHQRTLLANTSGGQPLLSSTEEHRVAGEIRQLQQSQGDLDQELALLNEKRSRLLIRAAQPGEVASWQPERNLLRRPVSPGEVLLTVVDQTGPWELELQLPEKRLAALDQSLANSTGEPVRAEVLISSLPGNSYQGRVADVERVARPHGEEGNCVLVRIALDETTPLRGLRSDTTATARLHCGQTSLALAWLGDVIDAFHRHVLFWW